MNVEQQRATLAIALMSAFADGGKDGRERDALERIAARLTGEGGSAAGLDMQGLYQDVIFHRVTVESAAAALNDARSAGAGAGAVLLASTAVLPAPLALTPALSQREREKNPQATALAPTAAARTLGRTPG